MVKSTEFEKTPAISPRALCVANELGVDWAGVVGSGRTGRIREADIRAAAGSETTPRAGALPAPAASASREATVLVTGGCGFIGTWVVRELLGRGLRVVVLNAGARPARWERVLGAGSASVPLVRGSLLNRELLAHVFAAHHVTHVIHLAALLTPACQADPFESCGVNVLGSVALLEQIRVSAQQIRGFSYASSVAVFGDEPDHASGATDAGNHPLTFYGAFKKSVELIAEQYWRHFQIASVGIRPQVAYGPEREVGLTAGPSLAARAAARGAVFTISYTGRVGYDYVEDVARAFVRGALETPRGAHIVDLAGEAEEVEEVIAAIDAAAPGAAAKLSVNGPQITAHAPHRDTFPGLENHVARGGDAADGGVLSGMMAGCRGLSGRAFVAGFTRCSIASERHCARGRAVSGWTIAAKKRLESRYLASYKTGREGCHIFWPQFQKPPTTRTQQGIKKRAGPKPRSRVDWMT